MGFGVGAYARIKGISEEEGRTVVNLTTSKKTLDNEYTVDFSCGFVRFFGKAVEHSPKIGDIIKITSCTVENAYKDKEGTMVFLKSPRYSVFDYDYIRSVHKDDKNETKKEEKQSITEDDLPF